MQSNILSSYIAKKIASQSSAYGGRIRTTAQTVRTVAQQLREDPNMAMAADAAERGAVVIDRIGAYVQETPLERIVADAEAMGRKQPWLLASAGIAAGIFASRLVKATAARRRAMDAHTP
ncbi:MAG TPA: hypothetical protein VK755_10680 [Candidatus Acidoferrales bacterium]|jgi:hypothetical protein|nr:hypothetical protein [Candidatus Acidoferrales bacterium]